MSTSLRLYELAQDYKALLELAGGDDLPDEVVKDTLESLGGELTDKVVNIAKLVRNIEASADTIAEAADELRQRADRLHRQADRIKAYTLLNMQLAGITKIECPYFTVSVHKNPEAVNINLPEGVLLPERFLITPPPPPPKPDKAKIKEALKAGENIEGCWLSQGEHLRIRV
jgi:hypothetical protein